MLTSIVKNIHNCNMKARRDVYQATAGPTRRAIINMIAAESYNVNAIAEKFDVTRQAISLHIQILMVWPC